MPEDGAESLEDVQELEALFVRVRDTLRPESRENIEESLWNEPLVAFTSLLYNDVMRTPALPEDVVDQLWTLGRRMGFTDDELLPPDVATRGVPPLAGGGHGPGRGLPGKSEFPPRWSDDDVVRHTMDVARRPSGAVAQPDGTFRAWGVRDGVDLRVVVHPSGEVLTAYPVAGEGVVTHPVIGALSLHVDRLRALVERLAPGEVRTGLDEQLAAGEWDQAVLQLLALHEQQALELDELAELAGLAGVAEESTGTDLVGGPSADPNLSEGDAMPQDPRSGEDDVDSDDAQALSRATGGVDDPDAPDQGSTTGTTPSGEFVGRVAGDDVGYAGETGAERRAEVGEDGPA